MTLNAPKRTKQGDRTKSSSKPKIGKEKKSEKWQVSRLGKMWGKEDLSRPKGKDEKGKDEKGAAVEDRNVFNNRHEVELAMIRFFDFTVEPGRRYQYRVAVQTFNPNYLRNDVASGDISTRPVLTGPPSEPSDDVVVESDVHWYVVKQDARNAENQFPRPKIEVHYWDDKMGEWLVTTFLHRLGDYIGVSGAKKIIKKVRFDSNTLTWKLTTESSDQEFNARAILIDFRGGNVVKPLGDEKSVTFKLPREMVAVNQFGDLIRRDQDSDVANEVRRAVVTNYEDLVKELESSEQSSGNAGNLGRNMLGGDDEDRGRGGRGGSRKGAGKAAGKAGPRGGGGGSGAGSAG